MNKRGMVPARTVLSVEGFYSLYHFNLSNRETRGELHDSYELVYVESGFYYVILDGVRVTVPPGSVVFFAPNAFHSGDGTTPVTATVRIISFECTSDAMHFFDNRVFPLDESERTLLLSAFDAAERALERVPGVGLSERKAASGGDLQRMKLSLELVLVTLYREGESTPPPPSRSAASKAEFRRISDYLKKNMSRPLTLSVIAAECSVSVSSLKALCRRFCNCGPIDYLLYLRVTEAKRLIRESSLNFTEIAEKTGFSSLHYFSRVFKARTGMSPSEYARIP